MLDSEEFPTLLDRLTSENETVEDRIHAADALSKISIRKRGNILPRGTTFAAAALQFPTDGDQERLIAALNHTNNARLHDKIISVLGQYGDARSVQAIDTFLKAADREERSILYAISAISIIGGHAAAEMLRTYSNHPSNKRIRASASHNLNEMNCGGTIAFGWDSATEFPPLAKPEMPPAARLLAVSRLLGCHPDDTIEMTKRIQQLSDAALNDPQQLRALKLLASKSSGPERR